ncbi:myogenesis-regulating glycosidase-like [Uloborus diversus]|uniref:myogenesis-regulating glycosidase-like n=1 Tax=Uloborus diversus TaxID=327109 RepID=UPI0024096300|nr:myogenesis-regulating glycosidase-like [Uloborus diversus]
MNFMKCLLLICIIFKHHVSAIVTDTDGNSSEIPTLRLDSLQLTLSSKLLLDLTSSRGPTLKGYLGWLPQRSNTSYQPCEETDSSKRSICVEYDRGMSVSIVKDNTDQCEEETETCHAVSCYKILWRNHLEGAMDCFVIGDDSWFGGGEELSQRWPMQTSSRSWYPAVTGDPAQHPTGNVMESLWVSSAGFALRVDHHVPLFVSFNESGSGKLCFTTSTRKHPYRGYSNTPVLDYTICSAMNVKDVYSHSIHRWFKKPTGIPEEGLFQYPIWSTWARYKKDINDTAVLEFAEEIKDSGFPFSQIEIDDEWETCYGDLDFDMKKFPDPEGLVRELNRLQFPVTLWVHPFCNMECETFRIGEDKGFWIKDKRGRTLPVNWWNGEGALLDTTNSEAVEWFIQRLMHLKEVYGIESFKFDAGEVLWLTESYSLHNKSVNNQPNTFTRSYANIAARFGGRVEVRVGHASQELPIFVRMFDKFSRWDHENGLLTLIPTALQLSLLGYYFILPDMVGGNNYESVQGSLPDPELYIRWLEANVFLPGIQFSIPPWDYDEQIVKIALKMVNLRQTYSHYILDIARESVRTGEPIIRPLWWLAPTDNDALNIDTQFLVGDGILVAPVLQKGQQKRDIYLPEGKWLDIQRNKVYEGSFWLYDYAAPLNYLPFFIRQA